MFLKKYKKEAGVKKKTLTPASCFDMITEVSRRKPLHKRKGERDMSSVEEIVEQSLLYDFYGELLTEHQQKIYEAALFENYSLSEIAEDAGISRQGVHDLLKRCDKLLRGYEEKLHLVERFNRIRDDVEQIQERVNGLKGVSETELASIQEIAGKLLEEL